MYTIESLRSSVSDVFKIQGQIYLKTEDNDILLPNVRIIQRLLINYKKYKNLIIVQLKESSIKQDKNNSSIGYNKSKKKEKEIIPLLPGNQSDPYPYQPLPNQDVPYSSVPQLEANQDKNDCEYSSQNQEITVNYQSYVKKTEEKDKDVMYSFSPHNNLIDKPEQDIQYKSKSKINDNPYSSLYNPIEIKIEKESKNQIANKSDLNYKKNYGNYDKNDLNIEDNTDDTHQLLQKTEDVKKITSEERNYRILNLPNDNKLDEYQPKKYDKYSAGNYSSMDQFNRFSSRQTENPSVNHKEGNNDTQGYLSTGYQSKLNMPQKEGETSPSTNYQTTFDLRNKVNDLRSQISNYTKDQKLPQENRTSYIDYSKIRGNNVSKYY